MKRTWGLVGIFALAVSLSACGQADPRSTPEWKAAYEKCAADMEASVKEYNDTPGIVPMETPDIPGACEGLADMEVMDMPSYTPAPAGEVDQECLREWAEMALDPDGPITGFEGKTVEEVMQDPMAGMACE